ncbi:MAG TPA: CoA ester lyase, partial [Quisquiliibacterium sp.]|nr:CoA ester lyase [Quisquiliibacterium sp.]
KAAALGVDYVFLDLEDAVAYSEKGPSRARIVKALNTLDWGKTVRCVRINDLTTEYAYEDIIEVVEGARENLDMIMLPKAMSASDVQFVDKLLTMMEKKLGLKKRIGIDVLIEEVEAMMRVDEIAASTPRLECLIFGMGDYSASQGVSLRDIGGATGYPGDIWHYQRQRLTIACRANRIDAVDGPYGDFKNPDGYREEARRSMILGMVGKWAIHPSQVAIAQEVFSPRAEDIVKAREMKKAYEAALAQGLGAVQYEGKMIDIASIRIVNNLLDRAAQIGM